MQKTFGAIYENGILRPLDPLALTENQRVSLTLESPPPADDSSVLDHEPLSSLADEDLPEVPLEQVQAALSKIPGSMTAAFAAEREERL